MPYDPDGPTRRLTTALSHEVREMAAKLSEREKLVLKAASIACCELTAEQLAHADQVLQELECCSYQELLRQRLDKNARSERGKTLTPNADQYELLGTIKERKRIDELLRQAITKRLERLAKMSPEDSEFLVLVQKYFEIEMYFSSVSLRLKTDSFELGNFQDIVIGHSKTK